MKLITFTYRQTTGIGTLIDNEIIDAGLNSDLPRNMLDFLSGGTTMLAKMQQLVKNVDSGIALQDVQLQAPVPRPGKYLAISLNYAEHIAETGKDKPQYPTFFNKQTTCVIADGEAIHRPRVSEKLDYEGELAIVIGQRCRHVPKEHAHKVIGGYTIANDVSVRDWQVRSPTFTLGKSFDTHGPLGPCLVTADEVGDPHSLNITTLVDDDIRQNSNTRHMLFDCYDIIAYLSTVMTLEPGDVISTGTPSGVGVKMQPRGYLRPGQTVRVVIEKIGQLSNPVIEEPQDTVCY